VHSQVGEELPFRINDADNHFVEPEDMYERYIAPKYRDKAVRFVRDAQGRRIQLYGSRPSKLAFTRESAPQALEELERLAAAAGPRTAGRTPSRATAARAARHVPEPPEPYRASAKGAQGADRNASRSRRRPGATATCARADGRAGIHAAIMFPATC
jgi:hypothetical protein